MQYAGLELALYHIIGTMLVLDEDTLAIVIGGTDMRARTAMAIALAEQKQAPPKIIAELRAVRAEFQKKDLAERRNQVVHGAQLDVGPNTRFRMLRYKKARRDEVISTEALYELAEELNLLASRAFRVVEATAAWQLGEHPQKNANDNLVRP